MAGSGKGKKKKNKGKSHNVHKSEKKKHGTSGSELYFGQTDIVWSKESNSMLEQLLIEKVELLYKKALEWLLDLGYSLDVATRALLMNGSIFGGKHVLSNIFSNALEVVTKGHVTDDKIKIEPIFDDLGELARFSMQTLINILVQDQSEMTKMDAILYLLQSNSLAVHVSSEDSSNSEDDKDERTDKETSKFDLGKMLRESVATLQGLHISASTTSSSRAEPEVLTSVSKPEITFPTCMTSESASDDFESESLEFMKPFTNRPDGVSLEDWLRTCSEDSMDLSLKWTEQIEKLTAQVKARREWAKKTVTQAAKRFNASRMELRELRLDKNEIDRLLKQKKELDSCNAKISEREDQLRSINDELAIANEVKDVLEVKNQEINAEIVSYNLSASESEKYLSESQRRERKTAKQCKDTEKNVNDLRRIIAAEKLKFAGMIQKMKQVNEAQKEAERRLREEKAAKEQARALLLEEKRLNRLERENSKCRLASLRHELDMKYRQKMDKRNRLELELSQLKAQDSSTVSSASSCPSAAAAASSDTQRFRNSRLCLICKERDVGIVFLPCAHQLLCADCNDEVYDALENQCPCCKALVAKRVQVYGPSS